jgi:hypothetical protein
MPSTYSTNLKIELIGTGEQSGAWGTTTNTNLGTALEEAIVGQATANFATDADLTLTLANSNAAQIARAFVLNVTGTISTTRNLIVPTINKPYIVRNNTTGGQSIVVKTSAGTGITVANGSSEMLYADGTNVVKAFVYGDVTASGTQTLTNKTIAFTDNTLTGVAGVTATQTLTNKTLTAPVISTISNTGTITLPTATDTLVGRATTDTLTNKTLTAPTMTGAVLNDGYTEEVYAVSGTTPALSPTNGSIQTWTLSGNSTPTAGTWAAGQSITLMVDDGTAYTITWTSVAVTWKTNNGNAPTLNTSGDTVIQLWKVGSTIYGARVGNA